MTPALAAALVAAQSEFPALKKDRTVRVASAKGSYAFRYATMDGILDVIQPILRKHRLAVMQPLTTLRTDRGHAPAIRTILMHESGETNESVCQILYGGEDMQKYGGAITYTRRYAYCALLGLSADEDDDGNSVAGNHVEELRPRGGGDVEEASEKADIFRDEISKLEDAEALRGFLADTRTAEWIARERRLRPGIAVRIDAAIEEARARFLPPPEPWTGNPWAILSSVPDGQDWECTKPEEWVDTWRIRINAVEKSTKASAHEKREKLEAMMGANLPVFVALRGDATGAAAVMSVEAMAATADRRLAGYGPAKPRDAQARAMAPAEKTKEPTP